MNIAMNIPSSSDAAGHYPAPRNHITDDPTPLNQAVYIPSVSPGYAIAAHHQNWVRDLPRGVASGDLNFLDPNNKLFHISHVMTSAGQALYQKRDCIIKQRDRSKTMVIADSGGYQIANSGYSIHGQQHILDILRWLEAHADWAMTLDVPTGPLLRKDKPYQYTSFRDCLDTTLDYLRFFRDNRKPGATKFLNVLQGNDMRQSNIWYNEVKAFEFEGWAFAGLLRHNFYNLCRRIIIMADEKQLDQRDWIHVLGTNILTVAVGLTALQRAINEHINPNLRISYDTSSPFRMIRWSNIFSIPIVDRADMTLPSVKCPDARRFVGSSLRFPWPSPLGDRMSLGDINVQKGANLKTYRDNQSNFYLNHHNLASLCASIALANRVFDSESLDVKHNYAENMGALVATIHEVIKAGSLDLLERKRSIFEAVRAVEPLGEAEDERDYLAD